MRTFLPWYGGKVRLVKKLLKFVPPHQRYIEVFGGAGALYFKKTKVPYEVFNDIHSDLINLYKVIRDKEKCKRLIYLLENTLYSRDEFYDAREKAKTHNFKDDVERAYNFFKLIRMSVGGLGCTFSIVRNRTYKGFCACNSSFFNAVKLLPKTHQRLQQTIIENLDWKDLLNKYLLPNDLEGTFVYLDPPYVLSERTGGPWYKYEFTDKDHEYLVDYLLQHRQDASFMLSGYPNKIYQKLEDNEWQRFDFINSTSPCANSSKRPKRIDSIWINYIPH